MESKIASPQAQVLGQDGPRRAQSNWPGTPPAPAPPPKLVDTLLLDSGVRVQAPSRSTSLPDR